jgi:hypothetical protein
MKINLVKLSEMGSFAASSGGKWPLVGSHDGPVIEAREASEEVGAYLQNFADRVDAIEEFCKTKGFKLEK